MSYQITDYTKKQADKLGVKVKPSTKPSKKIDVYKNGKLIASVGARGMMDFPNWIKKKGLTYANQRRTLYKSRHESDRNVPNSPGYYADKLLW